MESLNKIKNSVFSVFLINKSAVLKKEAQKLEEKRNYLEAIDKYLESLELNSADKEVYLRLGILYEGFEKFSQALEMYISALSIDINYEKPLGNIKNLIENKPTVNISPVFFEENSEKVITFTKKKLYLSLLAIIYEKHGDPDKAVKTWERILKISPGNLEALEALAGLYSEYNCPDLEKHRKILEKLFRKNPHERKICISLARIYHKQKLKTKEALDVYLKAREFDKGWSENILMLIHIEPGWIKDKDLAEIYEKALDISEEKGLITFRLARLKEKLRDFDGAEDFYKKALLYKDEIKELSPEYHLGKFYISRGSTDKAESTFKSLLEKDRNNMEGLLELKKILRGSSRKENLTSEDLNILERAFSLNPDYKNYNYLAEEYMKLYEPDEAIRIYRLSMNLKSQQTVLEKLIKLYRELNYWDNLVSALETSMEFAKKKEEKIDILLRQSRIYIEEIDNKEKAIEKLEEVLKLDSTSIDAHKELYYLNSINQDFKSISENFMALIDSKPVDGEVYNFIANVFVNLNNPLQTLYATQVALLLNQKHMEAMDRLLNLNKNYIEVFKRRNHVASEEKFKELVISKWEGDFYRMFYWLKPVLEQFYSHNIDKDILLQCTEVSQKAQDPFYYDISMIIDFCSGILLADKPRAYIYQGKEIFDIIMNKDKDNKPFLILNYDFLNKTSNSEKYFILGQYLCYLKRDNIIYKHLSRNLPVLLAEFIIGTLVHRIPLPIPKKLSDKCKNIPIEKFAAQIKNATIPSYFQDWAKKVIKDENKKNLIEHMIQGIDNTADQCGFLCCGNIKAATVAIVREQTNSWDRQFKRGEIRKILNRDEALRERVVSLWKFALNKNFMDIF